MDVWLRIDLNMFSIFVCLILAISMRSRGERSFLDYRLFMLMILGVLFELGTDTLMWAFDGSPSPAGRAFLLASTLLYYIAHPFAPLCYMLFAYNRVTGDARRLRRLAPYFTIPAVLSAALSAASVFNGWYFYLDASNVYHHGPLFLLFAAASFFYFIFAFAFVLARARMYKLGPRAYRSLILFPLVPSVAGVVQILAFGLVLVWPAMVLALLAIYVNIQQSKLSSDYLTGAFNRRRLDEFLAAKIAELRDGRSRAAASKRLAGFLADVDDFKRINDEHGHAVGDEALVESVRVLRSCLRDDDFLARYAGDEFVAVFSVAGEAELSLIVDRVRERFASRESRGMPYRLSLSIGAAAFDPAVDADADKFIERLDALMYLDKKAKNISRR